MILDGVRGKMGVVFSVKLINIVGPRPEPWGIPDVSGIREIGLDRVVNTCARSVKYERNNASDCL